MATPAKIDLMICFDFMSLRIQQPEVPFYMKRTILGYPEFSHLVLFFFVHTLLCFVIECHLTVRAITIRHVP
jgi:hypothetical protein